VVPGPAWIEAITERKLDAAKADQRVKQAVTLKKSWRESAAGGDVDDRLRMET
jgi:hypothetical protein